MKRRLVVVGACYLDTILTVPHYPEEDGKLRANSLVHRRGGNGPNTLEVLQQLLDNDTRSGDLGLSLCSVLPAADSAQSRHIKASLGANIDLNHSIYREDSTEAASSYIIRSEDSGSRTIVNYNELPEMTIDEFCSVAQAIGNDAVWYHFEGRIPDTTLACIQYLRKEFPSATVSVEVEKAGREGLEELAAEADVVFCSKSWAMHAGHQSARESLLCCTWGEGGVFAKDQKSGEEGRQAAYKVDGALVVDTIGAGDTFIAGMLYARLERRNWSLVQQLGFASELAGRKVTRDGFEGLGLEMLSIDARKRE